LRVDLDNSDIQTHVNLIQGIINRLSGNSASVKAWCVTVVTGILVVAIEKGHSGTALVALLPIVVFCLLDGYYLSLERDFRQLYNRFVASLHDGTLEQQQVYSVLPNAGSRHRATAALSCILSTSVWPFYLLLLLADLLVVQMGS